mgnify:CR=1 FL=1
MASHDETEDIILRKKLLEMLRRQQQAAQKKEDPLELVRSYLYDRGDEVLDAAMAQFPKETRIFVERLADLIKKGKITEKISGAELLYILRNIGIPVSIETKITILKDGKSMSLSDMLREKEES